eukprot:gene26386-biopygen16224
MSRGGCSRPESSWNFNNAGPALRFARYRHYVRKTKAPLKGWKGWGAA